MFSLDDNQKPVDDGIVVPEPVVTPVSDDDNSSVTPTPDPVPVPTPMPVPEPVADEAPAPDVSSSDTSVVGDDLADIQKQAINELAPILGKLDLSTEDKFKTTMMMVQATDNQSLLRDAHETAKAIEDDKARAQALLDIINEINFFTSKEK